MVAVTEGLDLSRISDAIRIFRTGSRRNPWTSPVLRSRMQDGRDMLDPPGAEELRALEPLLETFHAEVALNPEPDRLLARLNTAMIRQNGHQYPSSDCRY